METSNNRISFFSGDNGWVCPDFTHLTFQWDSGEWKIDKVQFKDNKSGVEATFQKWFEAQYICFRLERPYVYTDKILLLFLDYLKFLNLKYIGRLFLNSELHRCSTFKMFTAYLVRKGFWCRDPGAVSCAYKGTKSHSTHTGFIWEKASEIN